MSDTRRLALPYLDAAQSQKHVTHNEALRGLDALVQLTVVERDRAAPPASPAEGANYHVGAAPTGGFAGQAGTIACREDGAWLFHAPRAGWRLFSTAEGRLFVFDGATWIDQGLALRRLDNVTRLGVDAAPDAANPISARLNSALFTHRAVADGGSGDLRFVLNKEGAAHVVSQLYQDGFSGRAETGLIGDDHFRVKVSADGATWRHAIDVDPASGIVSFPSGLALGAANERRSIVNAIVFG